MKQSSKAKGTPPADTGRHELDIEVGAEANRQGKWEQALACFRSAREGLPKDARVYDGLGDAYRGLGQTKRARHSYEEAARLQPDEPGHIVKIAELRRDEGETDIAVQAFLMAGDLHWRKGHDQDALALWKQAALYRPNLAGIEERLANWHLRAGNSKLAVRHYMKLAETLGQQGRRLAALHVCTMALRLVPGDEAVQKATDEAWRAAAKRSAVGFQPLETISNSDLITAANELAQWQLTAVFRAGIVNKGGKNDEEIERNTHLGQGLLHEAGGLAGAAINEYELAVGSGLRLPALFFVLGLLYRLVGRGPTAQAALTIASQDPFYGQAVALLG